MGLGLRGVVRTFQNALPKPGLAMGVAVPVIHGLQCGQRMADGEFRASRQDIQFGIGDDDGDFQKIVLFRNEPGHFTINPDQAVFTVIGHQAVLGCVYTVTNPDGHRP